MKCGEGCEDVRRQSVRRDDGVQLKVRRCVCECVLVTGRQGILGARLSEGRNTEGKWVDKMVRES
jgi:hypothetical protein